MAEKTGHDLTSAQELGILIPEHTIEIQGEPLTLHELTFRQGLQLAVPIAILVQAIADRLMDHQDQPPASYFDELQQVFGAHLEHTQQIMTACCERPLEWIQTLDDAEGQTLLLATWLVNKDFFFRRLQIKILARRLDTPAAASPSPKSSVH